MGKINKFFNEDSDLSPWGEAKVAIRIVLILGAFYGGIYVFALGLRPDTDEYLKNNPDVIDARIRELKLMRSKYARPDPADPIQEKDDFLEPQTTPDWPDFDPSEEGGGGGRGRY